MVQQTVHEHIRQAALWVAATPNDPEERGASTINKKRRWHSKRSMDTCPSPARQSNGSELSRRHGKGPLASPIADAPREPGAAEPTAWKVQWAFARRRRT